jgi:hypothetical protein
MLITEAKIESTDLFQTDKVSTEKKADFNITNVTSLIAGIISLLIVAVLLVILHALVHLYKIKRIDSRSSRM